MRQCLYGLLCLSVWYTATIPAFAQTHDFTSEAFGKAVREYLLNNPELVVEALRAFEQKAEEARMADSRLAMEHFDLAQASKDAFLIGDGPVTIVEFFDYQCGFCKRSYPALERLIAQGQITVVSREFPILGPVSTYAARAALAAGRQGKYTTVHKALMEVRGQLSNERINALLMRMDLDMQQLRIDMEAPEVEAHIQGSYAIAQALNIRGTPAFIIGDDLHPGFLDEAALQTMIQNVRSDLDPEPNSTDAPQ